MPTISADSLSYATIYQFDPRPGPAPRVHHRLDLPLGQQPDSVRQRQHEPGPARLRPRLPVSVRQVGEQFRGAVAGLRREPLPSPKPATAAVRERASSFVAQSGCIILSHSAHTPTRPALRQHVSGDAGIAVRKSGLPRSNPVAQLLLSDESPEGPLHQCAMPKTRRGYGWPDGRNQQCRNTEALKPQAESSRRGSIPQVARDCWMGLRGRADPCSLWRPSCAA